jgi:archaellum component FlaF (FlaF/FlaG flagellin family)
VTDDSAPSSDDAETHSDAEPPDERTPPTDDDGGLSKRTLIRLLVGFGIGIPILIEALTFLGLLRQQLGGGDGDGTDGTATETTASGTDTGGVSVGDDLLPATDRSERLVSAVLRQESGSDSWPLSLTVEVTNDGTTDYEFQLLAVHLGDGETVGGRVSTDRLAPGESRTVTGEWSIPAGSTPRAVEVVALIYPDGEGSVETVERRVELAKIPVRGG